MKKSEKEKWTTDCLAVALVYQTSTVLREKLTAVFISRSRDVLGWLTVNTVSQIYIQPKSEVIICESLALFTCFNNISCKNNVFKYENGDLEKFNGEQSFFFFVICKYLEYFSSFVYVCTTVNGGMYYKNIVILCCVCEKNT